MQGYGGDVHDMLESSFELLQRLRRVLVLRVQFLVFWDTSVSSRVTESRSEQSLKSFMADRSGGALSLWVSREQTDIYIH